MIMSEGRMRARYCCRPLLILRQRHGHNSKIAVTLETTAMSSILVVAASHPESKSMLSVAIAHTPATTTTTLYGA
jgi:hypothetical protein